MKIEWRTRLIKITRDKPLIGRRRQKKGWPRKRCNQRYNQKIGKRKLKREQAWN